MSGVDSDFTVNSSLPVRVVPMYFCGYAVELPVCLSPATPVDIASPGPSPPMLVIPSSISLAWQMGSSVLPAARAVLITASYSVFLTAAVTSGGSWLSVSKQNQLSPMFSVSVNPSQLAVGTYQGSILVTSSGGGPPATLPVSLTVTDTAVPILSATPVSISFTAPAFNATPYSQTIAVTSDYGSAPFTVTHLPGTGGLLTSTG